MEKSETMSILSKIKTNYMDFSISEETINNWHDILKDYSYFDVEDKLQEYLKTDNDKPPRLNHLINELMTMEQKYDENNNYVIFCNLCGRKMIFRDYEQHYSRCLQVKTLWRKSKSLGKEIPREDIEQFGQDILDRLEEKYLKDTKLELKKI